MQRLSLLAIAAMLSMQVCHATAPLTATQVQQWRKRICDNFFVPDPLPALEAQTHRVFSPAPGVRAEGVTYVTQLGMCVPAILYLPDPSPPTTKIPKLGASFYLAQGDPTVRPVIEPNFYWDFGPQTPHGPGKNVAVFSNCDRLEAFIDGHRHATLRPDAKSYPHLRHSPFLVDLAFDGTGHPELRLDGYIGDQKVLSRSFSSDPACNRFLLEADDSELVADGADATRAVFRVAD